MNVDLKKTLWAAADKLRSSMDAAEYKHIVLGLIFLKYISDAFVERRAQLLTAFKDEGSDLHLPDAVDHAGALEERDYYTMTNVFWVPASARWEAIRAQAKQANIGVRIDAALEAIEADNPRLKGILDKRFGRTQLEPGRLGELVDLVSTIGFGEGHHAKDLLGEVYEYFLGQFASAEGKKGGQFYTPASVVKVLVEVLAPHQGRVYDPCCGSGGMFVQSEKFIEAHGGRAEDISVYGQEANPTTWRLVAMNLAIRGFAADLGKEPADTFHRDQHPDLRADYVLANPPFNISDWGAEKLRGDARWKYGEPPSSNANGAWLQHIVARMSPRGRAAVVLANGSLSSNQAADLEIRKNLVEHDLVEGVISLPTQLFFNTPIGACVWVLSKDKHRDGHPLKGRFVFVDARKLGVMSSRTVRELRDGDIDKIAGAFRYQTDDAMPSYEAGFSCVVDLAAVRQHRYALVPGRYVGFAEGDRPKIDLAEISAELEAVEASVSDIGAHARKALELVRKVANG